MIQRHEPEEVYRFIVDDFERTWEALVIRAKAIDAEKCLRGEAPGSGGGGNFLFALLGMILLEFGCRVCGKSRSKLADLRNALRANPLYFTPIPGRWSGPVSCQFPANRGELLTMLFDQIRNGKAHQYQSKSVRCKGGWIDIDITGPWSLGRGSRTHLSFSRSTNGLSILVRPDQLFADIKMAIETSGIMADPSHFGELGQEQKFTIEDFVKAMETAGHSCH